MEYQNILYHSGFGWFTITSDDYSIIKLDFCKPLREIIQKESKKPDILLRATQELTEYLNGERIIFSVSVSYSGTAFQQKVWKALQTIPFGETRTYGEIARMIGQPKASRAVGGACHRNPIGIIVPCHRVIGADGDLTGFGGGLHRKELLLEHEKKVVENRIKAHIGI